MIVAKLINSSPSELFLLLLSLFRNLWHILIRFAAVLMFLSGFHINTQLFADSFQDFVDIALHLVQVFFDGIFVVADRITFAFVRFGSWCVRRDRALVISAI